MVYIISVILLVLISLACTFAWWYFLAWLVISVFGANVFGLTIMQCAIIGTVISFILGGAGVSRG